MVWSLVGLAACAAPTAPVQPDTAPAVQPVEVAPAPQTAEAEPPRHEPAFACPRESTFGPVLLDPDQYRARHGVGVTRVADLTSSKAQPVEVCAVEGQLDYLVRLQCADGSNPFNSMHEAHAARAGNVGAGGRCDSAVDLYNVPCPEGDVEVYMDMYMCPRPSEDGSGSAPDGHPSDVDGSLEVEDRPSLQNHAIAPKLAAQVPTPR